MFNNRRDYFGPMMNSGINSVRNGVKIESPFKIPFYEKNVPINDINDLVKKIGTNNFYNLSYGNDNYNRLNSFYNNNLTNNDYLRKTIQSNDNNIINNNYFKNFDEFKEYIDRVYERRKERMKNRNNYINYDNINDNDDLVISDDSDDDYDFSYLNQLNPQLNEQIENNKLLLQSVNNPPEYINEIYDINDEKKGIINTIINTLNALINKL